MAKKQQEKRQVVFRRIGGRIVPIAIGGGLIAGGKELGKEKYYKKMFNYAHQDYPANRSRTIAPSAIAVNDYRNSITKRLSKTYQKPLNKFNISAVISDHPSLMPWDRRTSILEEVSGFSNKVTSNKILLVSRSRFDFLHELGHAKSYAENSITRRIQKAGKKLFDKSLEKERNTHLLRDAIATSKPNTLKRSFLVSNTRANFIRGIRTNERMLANAMYLPEEAAAWIRGAGFLRTRRQKIAMLKSGIKPFMSYAHVPLQHFGKVGLIGTGAALAGYGLFKLARGKNEK